jgi:hypothetical protein
MIGIHKIKVFIFALYVCSSCYHHLTDDSFTVVGTVTAANSPSDKEIPFYSHLMNNRNRYGRVLSSQNFQSEREKQKSIPNSVIRREQQQSIWYDESIDRFARAVIENTYEMNMKYDKSWFNDNTNTDRSIDIQCNSFDYEAYEGFEHSSTQKTFPYYDAKTDDSTNDSDIEDGDLIVSDGKYGM